MRDGAPGVFEISIVTPNAPAQLPSIRCTDYRATWQLSAETARIRDGELTLTDFSSAVTGDGQRAGAAREETLPAAA